MAVCGNCGAEGTRIRSRWNGDIRLPDECPNCAPQSFEAMKSVRDGTIAMGYEYMPTMYKKTDVGYVAKDELLADTEAELSKPDMEGEAAYQKAVAIKRASRRTKPMTGDEIQKVLARINDVQTERTAS